MILLSFTSINTIKLLRKGFISPSISKKVESFLRVDRAKYVSIRDGSLEDDVLGEFVKLGGLAELGDQFGVDGFAFSDVFSGVAGDCDEAVLGEDLSELGDEGDGLADSLDLH